MGHQASAACFCGAQVSLFTFTDGIGLFIVIDIYGHKSESLECAIGARLVTNDTEPQAKPTKRAVGQWEKTQAATHAEWP